MFLKAPGKSLGVSVPGIGHSDIRGLVTEQCGSKLWHSNDSYKRTIWQCNQKYKNEIRCKTSYIDEADIKARFMTATNILLSGRKKAIKAFEEAQATVFDTPEFTSKQNEYRSEMEVISQMMQRCIRENAP